MRTVASKKIVILIVSTVSLLLFGACNSASSEPPEERISGDIKVTLLQQIDTQLVGSTQFAFGYVQNLSPGTFVVDTEQVFGGGAVTIEFDKGRSPYARGTWQYVDSNPIVPVDTRWIARLKVTCNEVGPGNWTYHVEGATSKDENLPTATDDRSRATVEETVECIAPITTPGQGDSVAIPSIKIDEKNYPVAQFVPLGDEDSGFFWSTETGQLVQYLSGEDDWIPNPDPENEGFGPVDDLAVDTVIVPIEEWEQFCDSVAQFAGSQPGDLYTFVLETCDETKVLQVSTDSTPAATASGSTTGTRPTATPTLRGVELVVLKIGDAHYYIHQFDHLRSPAIPAGEPGRYLCGDNQYAVHLAGLLNAARSFEYPDEPLENPDPTGCGFGMTESFTDTGPDAAPFDSVLQADFPKAKFTAKVIGEWCRRVLPDLAGQNNAIQNLCERNPPQD